jgi:hypothetical protein
VTEPKIEPHRIDKPIKMLAVWFATLVLIDGSFLSAAKFLTAPAWVSPMLAIAAVAFVPMFLLAAFLMQTRFRTHLQDDRYYSEWLERQRTVFVDFRAENVLKPAMPGATKALHGGELLEQHRIEKYERQRGLFLIHSWRPSVETGQVADIVVWLHQHGEGPVTHGEVDRVEYQLGPKFFDAPVVKRNAGDKYKLEISAFGPALCIARVYFKNDGDPIELKRYLDFEEAP